MRCTLSAVLLLLAVGFAPGCGDDAKPSGSASGATSSSAKPIVSATPEPPKPKGMPNLLVDAEGPYIGTERVRMAENGAAEKLTKLIKELPINGQNVTLIVDKKAKITHVAATITELGKAGAPRVIVKTEGRADVPKELSITPEPRISGPAPCSETAMVMKDLSTALWPIKGGTARKHRKGFAGPDLSNTGDQIKKDLAGCDSNVAFFSADENIEWQMAYNLAGTLLNSDEKKKIDTLVLLSQVPVAGRPVALGK
jgi:biopolymer transport protein ExbD